MRRSAPCCWDFFLDANVKDVLLNERVHGREREVLAAVLEEEMRRD